MTSRVLAPSPAVTLPARAYTDALLFERERRELFARSWSPCARSAGREPGDFVATSIAREPVVVLGRRRRAARALERVPAPGLAARPRGRQLPARAALSVSRLDLRPRRTARRRARGPRLRRPRPRRRLAAAVLARRHGRPRARQPRPRRRAAVGVVRRSRGAPRGRSDSGAWPCRAPTSTSTTTTGR